MSNQAGAKPDYVQNLKAFRNHVDNTVGELLENIDTKGYLDKYNIKIEVNGKSIEVELHADSYMRLERFIEEEIYEYNAIMEARKHD